MTSTFNILGLDTYSTLIQTEQSSIATPILGDSEPVGKISPYITYNAVPPTI